MNWPFSKPVVKHNVVPRMVQKDFEKEEKKIEQFENVNKKFYKDVKRYIETIDNSYKSELKLINSLLNVLTQFNTNTNLNNGMSMNNNTQNGQNRSTQNSITTLSNLHTSMNTLLQQSRDSNNSQSLQNLNQQQIDEFQTKLNLWKQTHINENTNCIEKLKSVCQYDVIEPMKKLNQIFPNVYQAIKKREQAYNELLKQQQKFEKLQEKERTGQNLVKLEQFKPQLQIAKDAFQKEHISLMNQLPKLYESRLNYIYPCIQQLIKAQIEFYEQISVIYDGLLDNYNPQLINTNNDDLKKPQSHSSSFSSTSSSFNSSSNIQLQRQSTSTIKSYLPAYEQQIDVDIEKYLNDIRSLSIVAGD